MKKSLLITLLRRDHYCWHCGTNFDLVPHHRMNRGAGGSKVLDRPDNLLLVCAGYNWEMEADAKILTRARELGHKLRRTDEFSTPAFDNYAQQWFILTEEGEKLATDSGTPQF